MKHRPGVPDSQARMHAGPYNIMGSTRTKPLLDEGSKGDTSESGVATKPSINTGAGGWVNPDIDE
ncbi:hypothetical protein N9L26_00470 [Candidatus Pacebacteria bacterium]|nr:hypothetical protein [Candidatus Paceibacterota bacterium]